jgi:hypothetical protein
MKMCGSVQIQLQALLTATLEGDEWAASRSSRFIHRRKNSPYQSRVSVGPRTDVGAVVKSKVSLPLPGIEPRHLDTVYKFMLRI